MHILLGTRITSEDIRAADEMLVLFYNLVPQLYPEEMLSPNLHSVVHLSRFVQMLGPLWAYSCFGFEIMNGYVETVIETMASHALRQNSRVGKILKHPNHSSTHKT